MKPVGRPKKELNKDGTITCACCNISKYPDSFHKDKRSGLGYQTKCKTCQKEYFEKNSDRYKKLRNKNEKYIIGMRDYWDKNKDKINAYRKKRYSSKVGRLKVLANNHERRALKKSTTDGTVTYKEIINLLKKQDYKCAISGLPLEEYHIDHIIPLNAGGKHTISNIQLLLPSINMSKKDNLNYKYERK